MTWLMTGLNYIGIRRAANFQLVFTWLKVLLVLVIAITCFASAHGLAANFGTVFTGAEGGFAGFMVALIAALWAYDGWNDLNMVAGEVRNPERNVPLALLFGVGIVGFLYISVNAAIQYMLPAVAVAASPRPAVAAVSVVLGATGATLVTAGMALSIFVTLNGTIMSGARVPFAAARDGLFFKKVAELSPRFGTPAPSLVLQASLSTLLLLAVGRFQQLFELAIFAEWLFYMIASSTIFVHRRRRTEVRGRAPQPSACGDIPCCRRSLSPLRLCCSSTATRAICATPCSASAIILAGVPLFYFFQAEGDARSALGASAPCRSVRRSRCPHGQGGASSRAFFSHHVLQYSFPSGTAHMHCEMCTFHLHWLLLLLRVGCPIPPRSRFGKSTTA